MSCKASRTEEERLSVLGGPQGGFPGGGAHLARLLLHGRDHPARAAAAGAQAHEGDVWQIWPARRQRISRGRRQSASAHSLRRQCSWRAGKNGRIRRRYPQALRRGRRRSDRRARRRRREARPDARDVLRNRPQPATARQVRLRCQRVCSTPARYSRNCTAAPNWAACTCTPANCHSPTFQGSNNAFRFFCSPKADVPGFGPETGRGFFEFLDFNVEAEALGFIRAFRSSIISAAGTRSPPP